MKMQKVEMLLPDYLLAAIAESAARTGTTREQTILDALIRGDARCRRAQDAQDRRDERAASDRAAAEERSQHPRSDEPDTATPPDAEMERLITWLESDPNQDNPHVERVSPEFRQWFIDRLRLPPPGQESGHTPQ